MTTKFNKNLLAALIAGMLLPMAASASEADLLKKIEALAQQNELLAQPGIVVLLRVQLCLAQHGLRAGCGIHNVGRLFLIDLIFRHFAYPP